MAAPTVRPPQDESPTDAFTGHFLVVLGLEHTLTTRLPPRGTLAIGRDEDADVRVIDALASRAHARLHLGEKLEIEDLGSANGTRLRDQPIPPFQRIPVVPGDAIAIGTTLLVIQRQERAITSRRIWPHGYFETRLIEACAQAEAAKGAFAVMRLRVVGAKVEQTLALALRPGDVLASYAPDEYEILFVDTDREKAETRTKELVTGLEAARMTPSVGVAFFPGDGTSPQALVSRACERLVPEDSALPGAVPVVLESSAMQQLYAVVEKVARSTINVLIVGETGAGKEVLAQAIHRSSPRADQPLICVNCAALSDSLLESELFGYEKGAFTGAIQARAGLIEAAAAGTLFLDEIGEMSLSLQAKILRALETKQVLRVGATRPRTIDVRFLAATNRDLEEEVAAKRFREDLYFRLNGITLAIPPLRERIDEIPSLAGLFLDRAAKHNGQPRPVLGPDIIARLQAYSWPGNIRELRNVMERALVLSATGQITAEHLPVEKTSRSLSGDAAALPAVGLTTMAKLERQAIRDALVRCAGNQTRAAELLGMPRRTFCKRLREYNVLRPQD
jgi:DNA-binding NtrC family response regulator